MKCLCWWIFHGLLALECLRILNFLRLIAGHCLAGSNHTNPTIDRVWRFKNTRLGFATKSEMALALLASFLLKVLPHVLFDLGALLLHLNFVRVLKCFHLLPLLLFDLVGVAVLHSKMLRKLKLCYSCWLLTSSPLSGCLVVSRSWRCHSICRLPLSVCCLLISCHSDIVHRYGHFLAKALVADDVSKLGTSQIGCRKYLRLFVG